MKKLIFLIFSFITVCVYSQSYVLRPLVHADILDGYDDIIFVWEEYGYFTSIQDAHDSPDTEAGTAICVMPGTYTETLNFTKDSILLFSFGGPDVTFVNLLQSSNRGFLIAGDGIKVGGGSGMGFTFSADGGRMIELAANEADVEISHNIFVVDGGGTIGVNVGAAGATRLKVKDNTFKISSGQGGFYATKSLKDCEITGNEFIGQDMSSGYAIQMSGFYNGIIADNYIHADTTNGTRGFASGIFPHTVTSDPHASDSLRIFNNIVQDCANGIRLGHTSQTADMKALFIYENIIQHCTDGIEIANDAQVYPGTYDIYNNTFSDNTNHVNTSHATAANYGLNTFDELVAINGIDPVAELDVTGDVFVSDTLFLGNGEYFENETNGEIHVKASFEPEDDKSHDLGGPGSYWNGTYTDALYVSDSANIDTLVVDSFIWPDANEGANIGASGTRFNLIYGDSANFDAITLNDIASSNTLVLTPTSSGVVDTLETTDLAAEDFIVTGLWTFDNVVIDSADIDTANVDYLYVSEGALFDSVVSVGSWGYTGEHIVIPQASSNTNAGLGIYGMVNYSATAGKVFAGTYSRALAMTTNQANQSTIVGTESQFRLRDVDIADGVHAGLWAYAEQSGTSALSGGGTFDAISATIESEAGFSAGATEHVTGITIDGSIHASATINASANFTGLYIKSNGKDWFDGIKITGCDNAVELQNSATIDNSETDTLILTETVVKVDGNLEVTGAIGAASLAATGIITGKTLVCLHTAATYIFASADSCKNAAHFNSDADPIDFTLPGAEAGLVVLFYDIGGGVITIDPVDGTDTIYLNGTSVGAGDAIDSPGDVGDFICLMAIDDTRWVTVGRSGVWTDGGAD